MVAGLLLGCVGGSGPKRDRADAPDRSQHSGARADIVSEECDAVPAGDAPLDQQEADFKLTAAMDRAWACGLHTMSHFDLTLRLRWAHGGCVAVVELDDEIPSGIGECLLRQFEKASIAPFRRDDDPPRVVVRMTNDRTWWSWQ